MENQRVTFKPLRFKKMSRQDYRVYVNGTPKVFGNRKSARQYYRYMKKEMKIA